MNQLQVFNFNENEVRVVLIDNNPWYVLKDVCNVLGIKNATDVTKRLDEDEVTRFNLGGLSGESNIVSESGLYSVVLRSDKPEAKVFQRWNRKEVLPTIRKHGAYMSHEVIEKTLSDPDFIIRLATDLKEERSKRVELEIKNSELQPKALFADSVSASHTSILIGELAKLIKQNGVDIGQNRLFEDLRNDGFLIKRKGADYNMPTQKSMDMMLMEIKERSITNSDGSVRLTKTTKITGKGQIYFVNRYLGN